VFAQKNTSNWLLYIQTFVIDQQCHLNSQFSHNIEIFVTIPGLYKGVKEFYTFVYNTGILIMI
jgi:hypothetical protein